MSKISLFKNFYIHILTFNLLARLNDLEFATKINEGPLNKTQIGENRPKCAVYVNNLNNNPT